MPPASGSQALGTPSLSVQGSWLMPPAPLGPSLPQALPFSLSCFSPPPVLPLPCLWPLTPLFAIVQGTH